MSEKKESHVGGERRSKPKKSSMSDLPDDIIADILSRLTVRSLLRFRCVSNRWRNIILSPSFAKLHLKRTSEHNAEIDNHTVLFSSSSQFTSMNFNSSQFYHFNDLKLDFPTMGQKKTVRVLGSCNGLIFLRVGFQNIIMWNPSTRYYKVLPKPGFFHTRFAFGGFGFDASVDDYKVVIGIYKLVRGDSRKIVEVFTLNAKSNIWRKVQDIGNPDFKYEAGTFANGALHWLKKDGAIMSFDLAREEFGEFVTLPEFESVPQKNIYVEFMELGVLQGCLGLYVPENWKDDELWVMKEYGVKSSWSKLFLIPFESVKSCVKYIRPLCILKSGEVLMDVDGFELVAYSPKNNTYNPIRYCHKWFETVVYVESLVSLN